MTTEDKPLRPRGRGAADNPPNRFAATQRCRDPEFEEEEKPAPATQFITDHSQSILSHNDSPDIPFEFSINPYRGCEHGCVYCYARPTHEYLGYSSGLDFETRILVKENAPELLRQELASPKWQPQPIALSGVTDPYQPVERRLQLTRRCLAVLAEFRNPVMIATKNHLVTRDLDLLVELAWYQAAVVSISLTSLDNELIRRLEPRTSPPRMRLEAMTAMAQAGVPVGVLVAPVIPALNDHEIPRLLEAAAKAGARWAFYEILRLPHAVKDLFQNWLASQYPEKQERVIQRLRDMRGGALTDSRFGHRMSGEGIFARQIEDLFAVSCRRWKLPVNPVELSTASFHRPLPGQLELF